MNLFFSADFLASHFYSLNIIKIASKKIVGTPVQSESTMLDLLSHTSTNSPARNPVKNPRNMTEIKPKPNDIINFASALSYLSIISFL